MSVPFKPPGERKHACGVRYRNHLQFESSLWQYLQWFLCIPSLPPPWNIARNESYQPRFCAPRIFQQHC
jgi:hypothetical protein